MDNKTNNTRSGISFFSLLALLFIALKLCHVITWPLLWVLAPLWIPTAIGLIILALLFIADIYTNAIENIKE